MIMSDIPAHGSGLGSSSAITVGLLNALYRLFDGQKASPSRSSCSETSPSVLATVASHIEIHNLKKPIGKQDQYAAAYGGFNSIRFSAGGCVDVVPQDIPKWAIKYLNEHLLLCYSGLERQADDILQEQNDNTDENLLILNRKKHYSICFLSKLRKIIDGKSSDFSWVNHYLILSWARKRELANDITTPEIDAIYRKAMESGAEGGKLCGAGGGGFFLFYVLPENRERLIDALGLDVYPFTICAEGSEIIFEA